MFPVFKPKTPFYCEEGNIYAYIGTKEGVNTKSKYEILETKKNDKGEISYSRVADVRPQANTIWDNQSLNIAYDNFDRQQVKGTKFNHAGGRSDICDQGLLMREKGTLGYQYKLNRWYFSLSLGKPASGCRLPGRGHT